jgi:NAD(P)-dependent dehydrogenase (short-subunit alcohol dehydrogenase family)
MGKVYLITGTSTGFGRALAEVVLARGDSAVVTARRTETLVDLVERYPETALAVKLDVTSDEDRKAAIRATMDRFGQLDVLVNNAGQGSLGAIEEFSSEQIRSQFEVNTFGVIEMTRAALPVFRQQRSGHILCVTSVGGIVSIGGFSLYCATKYAVEGFAEGLRDEAKSFGVKVTLVEPGAFRTDFAGSANMRPVKEIEEYSASIEPLKEYLYGNDGKQPGDPRKAAEAMVAVVESEEPPLRLLLGADAYGVWEQKSAEREADFAAWQEVGLGTAFEGEQVRPIGG